MNYFRIHLSIAIRSLSAMDNEQSWLAKTFCSAKIFLLFNAASICNHAAFRARLIVVDATSFMVDGVRCLFNCILMQIDFLFSSMDVRELVFLIDFSSGIVYCSDDIYW